MDPRKQKRLGPAPIASFEKSFEDNSSAITGVSLPHCATKLAEAEVQDINRNGDEMDPLSQASKAITTTSSRKEIPQQQQPSISVTQTSTAAGSSSRTTPDELGTKTRPPPLKATTKAPTTLVSSGEQQVTFRGTTTLTAPSTPRIELSRASSSSYHEEDSRDSSPENVFEQVGTGTLQEAIGLGFREEGALELRSSTEELYFMDSKQKKEEEEKIQQQQQQQAQQQSQQQQLPKRSSPLMFKFDEHQSYLQQHQRKDSASSEVAALLCISGRTSRISSVGSQGSAVSHLSAVSGVSRSPSPHRMLLETSFCGPKPLENLVDGRVSSIVEPTTAEILEQVLLARKQDPTQVVLAEGIRVESSPKRIKPTTLSNGDSKVSAKIASLNRPSTGAVSKPVIGRQRQSTKSPGHMVIGKTPSGTEYIRINLKPDHMYNDKGIAPNERIVEAPNTLAPVTSKSSTQMKPISLSLGRNVMDETRLTPTASPKPLRHGTLTKDPHGSRSPSPGNVPVSRKSSFNSIFRVGGKDSPDSPRERSQSRSKSKDRQTPQSLNATPSKQKSVLAIFKPNKRGSNAGADGKTSKSSSPIDGHDQHTHRSKSNTPLETATGSRPASRLRYYDEPVEGVIHIPLHTPPEEKETRKLLQSIAQLTAEPIRPVSAPVTASQLAAAAAALKPVGSRKGTSTAKAAPRPQQIEKLQRIENLDAIHTLQSQDDDNKEQNWSLEVQRHSSSLDSQETLGSDASGGSAIKVTARSNLANVHEQSTQENHAAAAAEIHRLPFSDSTAGGTAVELKTLKTVSSVSVNVDQGTATEDAIAKEKRRLLFATRIGSGSEEQIFSTQFSISKTESQSSQLSEQVQTQGSGVEQLQRMDTVIRRTDETQEKTDVQGTSKRLLKRIGSIESATGRTKSVSTSEDEKTPQQTTVAAIVLRRKDSQEELRRKPHSAVEDDVDGTTGSSMANQRHSRYLENFDVRRKYHENVPRKPKRQSISEAGKAEAVQAEEEAETAATIISHEQRQPKLPQPPPPSTAPTPSPPPVRPKSASGSRSPTPTNFTRETSKSQSPIERSQSRQTPTKPPRTITPTRQAETESPQVSAKTTPQAERQSVHSTDEPIESSESERDSETAAISTTVIAIVDPKRRHMARHVSTIEDHESTGLVSQESFDDELPYIPTTLPEERAQGVAIIPMKERANMELKTCSVDRPRSTTPLNPSHLEEYCGIMAATPPEPTFISSSAPPVRGEKLRISLPRKDAVKEKAPTTKSPRRASNASGKTWFEFAEEGLRASGSNLERKDSNKQLIQQKTIEAANTKRTITTTSGVKTATKATPNTTKVTSTSTTTSSASTRKLSGHWIDFENIPEKRKPAKRITALPKDSSQGATSSSNLARNHVSATVPNAIHHHAHHHAHQTAVPPDVTATDGKQLHYNYVKPEDCQCECHETTRDTVGAAVSGCFDAAEVVAKPLSSVDLLQQGEDMLPLLDPDIHDGIEPSDSSRDLSCYTDDEADAPLRQGSQSRYRAGSNKNNEFPRRDGSRSPRNRKFPDHRYS